MQNLLQIPKIYRMVKKYIQAARLRTLPLSVSGIIVGSFLAAYHKSFDITICLLALLTTIGFQVLSNFANDYGDGIKGTDADRKGEKRLIASGEISPKQMLYAMYITTFITLIIAIALIYISFGKENFTYSLLFFGLGIASIVASIKYTVGKNAYGYSGFGDIFVFLFFGLLSVCGSYFLYTKSLSFSIFLPACSVGLLSVAVLNLNNMRDKDSDIKTHKNTLVVKNGMAFAKKYHFMLIGISFLLSILYTILNYHSVGQFIFLLAYIPLIKHLFFVIKNKEASLLDSQLKVVALSTFVFSVLFGIGQLL